MAQGIRHRSLTAEARICASVSPCSGQTGTGTGLLTVPPSSLSSFNHGSPYSYIVGDEEQAR
jgi:hypothetical protein